MYSTTYFRAKLSDSPCTDAYSNTVQISVSSNPGGIATTTTSSLCEGSTATIQLISYTGSVQWQESTNGSSGWTDVSGGSGATTANYTTASLSTTTYYRAKLTSLPCTDSYSIVIPINISQTPIAGNINSSADSICSGNNATLNLSGQTGSIQWQQSATGSSGWANVTGGSGANTAVYTTSALNTSTYYRAKLSSSPCSDVFSNIKKIEVLASPIADYSYITNGYQLTFTNLSTNSNSYNWNFGDASGSSTQTNPVHTYSANGSYSVILDAYNYICDDQETKTINLNIGIEDQIIDNLIKIYPNRRNGIVYIEFTETYKKPLSISIYNSLGELIGYFVMDNDKFSIDCSKYNKGAYYFTIKSDENIFIKKVVLY